MTSLERLARGVLLPGFSGARPPGWLLRELEGGLAGVTLFAVNGNVPDADGLSELTAQLRESGQPVISMDEEGGDVTRLAHPTGSPYPGNAALGVVDDVELTARVYRSLGAELAYAGVTLNLAPTVDVNTAADNPIIGTRAFGADPALVARHAAAAVRGLQDAGISACAKHFPGHGATVADSHEELPVVSVDLDVLRARELVPFQAAIDAGVHAIMTGHLVVPALTGDTPATLSADAITGLLRETLYYDGVVITDALDMQGASGELGIPEAAVRSLIAGNDLLCLGPHEHEASVQAVVAAIVAAVRSGRVPEERLAEAVERVDTLRHNEFRLSSVDWEVGADAAARAIAVRGEVSAVDRPLVVEVETPRSIAVGPVPWGLAPFLPPGDHLRVDPGVSPDVLLARAAGRSLVVVVRDAHRHAGQRELVTALLAKRPDTIVVEMGLPVWHPEGNGNLRYVASYGAALANGRAVAQRLGLTTNPA